MSAIARLWNDVKGNAKWDFLKWLVAAIITGVVAVGVWGLRHVTRLTHGLTPEQQQDLLAWYGAILAVLVIVSTLLVVVILRRKRTSPATSLLGVPTRRAFPATVLSPPPNITQWGSDLRVEVQEIIYQEHASPYSALLGRQQGWYILMKLRITNRGSEEPTITAWSCETASLDEWSRQGSIAKLWPNTYIERPPVHHGAALGREDIQRPTLDEVAEREPFRRGIPQIGWVLFDVPMSHEYFGPFNVEFKITLRDSMGGTHEHVEPAQWSKNKGALKSGL